MKIIIIGTVENVKTYTGKNGFGANVELSQLQDKRRETLEFNITDQLTAAKLEDSLQEEVTIEIDLTQNKFGLRFGEIYSLSTNE